MVFDGNDFADLLNAGVDAADVQGLNGVHVDHARLNALGCELFRCLDGQANGVAVGNDGNILAVTELFAFSDLEGRVLIVDHGDRVAGKAQVHRAFIFCRRFDQRLCRIVVSRHDDRHIRKRAHDAHVLDGLVAGAVVCGGQSAVGAGNLDVQVGIADLLADHLADAHAAKRRISDHKGDLAAGCKPCRNACTILLGDADIQVLVGERFMEGCRLAALADVDVQNKDIRICLAGFYNGFAKAVTGRNLFRLHVQASSLM